MRDDGGAEFELEMSLKDSSSKIFLFKVRFILIIIPLFHIDDVKWALYFKANTQNKSTMIIQAKSVIYQFWSWSKSFVEKSKRG